jgi:hypothetical protein
VVLRLCRVRRGRGPGAVRDAERPRVFLDLLDYRSRICAPRDRGDVRSLPQNLWQLGPVVVAARSVSDINPGECRHHHRARNESAGGLIQPHDGGHCVHRDRRALFTSPDVRHASYIGAGARPSLATVRFWDRGRLRHLLHDSAFGNDTVFGFRNELRTLVGLGLDCVL